MRAGIGLLREQEIRYRGRRRSAPLVRPAGPAPPGQRGTGASAVLVKKDQMTAAAPGVFPLGGGKL
jgi:hypothetical protein